MLCDSYVAAIRSATPEPDRGNRHGAARAPQRSRAERSADRLKGKISADFDTLRRLFTLLTALHRKG